MNQNVLFPLLSLIPALLNAGILIYLFCFLPKSKTINIFGLFVLALMFWQVQDFIVRICDTEATARFWDSLLCVGWIGLGPFAFHFACRYAGRKRIYDNRLILLCIYLPFICFLLLHVGNHDLEFVWHDKWGWIHTPAPGSMEGFTRFCVSLFVMASLCVLFAHMYEVRHDKAKRMQVCLVALGMLIPTQQGIITQVLLPLVFQMEEVPLTSTFLTIFSVATFISLSKYRLFDFSESVEMEVIMQQFTNVVMVLSPDRKVLYMNPFAMNKFKSQGKHVSEVKELFASQEAYDDFIREVFTPAYDGQHVSNMSALMISAEGRQVDLLVSAEPVKNNSFVQGILVIGNDITERLQNIKALKESNERYDLVSKATNDMVWDWNLVTGTIYRNKAGWTRIFGTDLESEIAGDTHLAGGIYPDDEKELHSLKEHILTTEKDHLEMEFRILKPDGIGYVLDRCFIIRDENGVPVRVTGATQDITEKRRAELLLKEEQLLKQKEITNAVIKAQEDERQHIGAELHDNVNQLLASALLFAGLTQGEKGDDRHMYLDHTKSIINKAIEEIRSLSHALIAPSLHGETLIDAMFRPLETIEKAGIVIVPDFSGFDEALISEKLKLTIYRIVQEQCNNILKYAQATRVSISIEMIGERLMLTISDNGIGFDTSKKGCGVGLTNIKTRSQLHNGEVKIVSSPQNGCKLQVSFPIQVMEEV